MNAENTLAERESAARPIALGVAVAAGIVATLLRVVPHPPNFSAVGGLGLFGGARLGARQAYLFPIAIMVVSDLVLWVLTGFDYKYSLAHPSRLYVYLSFMVYVYIGRWLRDSSSVWSIALAGTLGGVQFFVVTNFCEWLFQPWQPYYDQIPDLFRYSRDLNGLATCFMMALPFYQGELPYVDHPFMLFTDFRMSLAWTCLGDVFFTTVYILVYGKLAKRAPAPEQVPVPVTNG